MRVVKSVLQLTSIIKDLKLAHAEILEGKKKRIGGCNHKIGSDERIKFETVG